MSKVRVEDEIILSKYKKGKYMTTKRDKNRTWLKRDKYRRPADKSNKSQHYWNKLLSKDGLYVIK